MITDLGYSSTSPTSLIQGAESFYPYYLPWSLPEGCTILSSAEWSDEYYATPAEYRYRRTDMELPLHSETLFLLSRGQSGGKVHIAQAEEETTSETVKVTVMVYYTVPQIGNGSRGGDICDYIGVCRLRKHSNGHGVGIFVRHSSSFKQLFPMTFLVGRSNLCPHFFPLLRRNRHFSKIVATGTERTVDDTKLRSRPRDLLDILSGFVGRDVLQKHVAGNQPITNHLQSMGSAIFLRLCY
jgi:hypothetical protein